MGTSTTASISGWQEDRRRALLLLQRQFDSAINRGNYQAAMAWRFAIGDIEDRLKLDAQAEIAISVRMTDWDALAQRQPVAA